MELPPEIVLQVHEEQQDEAREKPENWKLFYISFYFYFMSEEVRFGE